MVSQILILSMMKYFLKEFIKRELDTSFLLMLSNPNNQVLKVEFKLVYSMYHSNFNEILAARLNSLMNIDEFAIIYHQILSEHIDELISNW